MGMISYTIIPRGRSYWIEAIDGGFRRTLERFDTEDEAIKRLHVLKERAEKAEHPTQPSARGFQKPWTF
jgi:hypothetical protein